MVKVLTIWFRNGSTAQFEQVDNMRFTNGVFNFSYYGLSHQTIKHASFLVENIGGHAVGNVDPEILNKSKEAYKQNGHESQSKSTSDEPGPDRKK